ncbi:MAG: alpha-hydroxy-acid oxidizing protein, partial [Oscillospiraceae bacterium]|nr:alpha-hydroxy-acid oxidizing protein [Oscillospiraceae bacterium]
MDYNEILQAARTCMGPYCKACPVCNGRACGNTVPGPGSKGLGVTFQRNYQKWQEICVQMDTICENRPADTTFDFFGAKLRLPVLAAPVGAMKLHYGDKYDDATYNDLLVSACRDAGILACTGDGIDAGVMAGALQAINHAGGLGVPTVKPWDRDTVFEKLEAVRKADPVAVAMDIDGAGLP